MTACRLYADKTNVTFRCDNPYVFSDVVSQLRHSHSLCSDGNCEQTTAAGPWAGHWRGENATQETVLCPPTCACDLCLRDIVS